MRKFSSQTPWAWRAKPVARSQFTIHHSLFIILLVTGQRPSGSFCDAPHKKAMPPPPTNQKGIVHIVPTGNSQPCLPVSSFHFPVSSFQFPTSSFQLPVSNFQFPISSFQFPVSNFQFQISSFKFPVSNFQFQISSFKFQISSLRLPPSLR